MPRPKKTDAQPEPRADAFKEEVERALKHFADLTWLGKNSTLASPYFLQSWLTNNQAQSEIDRRGNALQRLLRAAANKMFVENKQEGEKWGELMEAVYFSGEDLSIPQITERFMISSSTYNHWRNDAIDALIKELLKLAKPSLRLEMPILPQTLIGRDDVLEQCLVWLGDGKSVALYGTSGVGKSSLGAIIAQRFAPQTTFWYSFQPGLNDSLYSLLFALGYFLQQHGVFGLWSEIVARHGAIKLPVLQNLLRDDLSKLSKRPILFCFDEVDLLRPGEVESHTQLVSFLESLRQEIPLLLISQKPLIHSDFSFLLSGLLPEEMAGWFGSLRLPLAPTDLNLLHQYSAGNPRLLELFLTLYQVTSPEKQSFQSALTSLRENPSVESLLRRIWQHLDNYSVEAQEADKPKSDAQEPENHERVLLELLAVFRHAAPAGIAKNKKRAAALAQFQLWRLVQVDANGSARLLPVFKDVIHGLMEEDEKQVAHLEAALVCDRYGQRTEAAYHLLQTGDPKNTESAIQLLYLHREHEIDQGQAEAMLALLPGISQRQLNPKSSELYASLRTEIEKLLGNYDVALKLILETHWRTPFLKARAKRMEGDIRELRGEIERALSAYREGMETIDRWFAETANYHRALGYLHLNEVAYDHAQIEVHRIRHEAANLQGAIHEFRGEISAAQVAYQEALQLAQAANYPYGEANTQKNLGRLCGWRRQLPEAERHLGSAIEFFTNTGRLNKQASAIYDLAFVRRLCQEYELARQSAEESLQLFERLGESVGTAISLELLSEICLGLGQIDQAEQFVTRAQATEDTHTQPDALRTLGEIRLIQGNWAEAENLIQQSVKVSKEIDDKILEAYAYRALGKVYLAQKQSDQAGEKFQYAIDLFNACGIHEESMLTENLHEQTIHFNN